MTPSDIEEEWRSEEMRLVALRDELSSQEWAVGELQEVARQSQQSMDACTETRNHLKFKAKVVLLSEFSFLQNRIQLEKERLADCKAKMKMYEKNIAELKNYITMTEKSLQRLENRLQMETNVVSIATEKAE